MPDPDETRVEFYEESKSWRWRVKTGTRIVARGGDFDTEGAAMRGFFSAVRAANDAHYDLVNE